MKPRWVAVFDFDGTCIPKSLKSLFNILDKELPQELVLKAQNLRAKYIKKAVRGKLTLEEEQKWYFDTIGIYVEAELAFFQIQAAFENINLREGVAECFEFLRKNNVPIAIISYGVLQFIEAVLRANKALHLVSRIYSGQLKFGRQGGAVIGCDEKTIIFPSNKGRASRDFADTYGVPYESILAVGDSATDARLGYLKKNRLGIIENEAEKKELEKFMGAVLVSDNFLPVRDWLAKKMNIK